MPENQEVEVKLTYEDKEKIETFLKKEGADFKGKVKQTDIYFGEEKGMSKKNDLLRIRKIDEKTKLTFKGSTSQKDDNITDRLEISTLINDTSAMKKILERIGLKEISKKKSIREKWNTDALEITFIKFTSPKELEFMEIEGQSREAVEKFQEKIDELTEEVGEEIFKKVGN